MLDALTLDQMRTFVVVVESGSFRSGATRLSRVQSAVSHAIANLEATLGVSLFDRSGHRPVLTPEGQALLTNARDILLRVDAMRARARGLGEGVELELSLIVDVLFPLATVGAALEEMRSVYPTVSIRLAVSPLGGPLEGLINRRFTLGIMAGEDFPDPAISRRALAEVQMIAVVSPAHPLGRNAGGVTLGSPDLADHLQIVLSDPSQRSEGRDFGVLSPQTCRVSNQDAKHALILAGLGWADCQNGRWSGIWPRDGSSACQRPRLEETANSQWKSILCIELMSRWGRRRGFLANCSPGFVGNEC